MRPNIKVSDTLTNQHYVLLFEADPNKELVNNYLQRSFCFDATYNNELVGILALFPTHPETLEIVNIAVVSEQRNRGIGQQLLSFAEK